MSVVLSGTGRFVSTVEVNLVFSVIGTLVSTSGDCRTLSHRETCVTMLNWLYTYQSPGHWWYHIEDIIDRSLTGPLTEKFVTPFWSDFRPVSHRDTDVTILN